MKLTRYATKFTRRKRQPVLAPDEEGSAASGSDIAANALQKLADAKLVDDKAFATYFVKSRQGGWCSRRRLRNDQRRVTSLVPAQTSGLAAKRCCAWSYCRRASRRASRARLWRSLTLTSWRCASASASRRSVWRGTWRERVGLDSELVFGCRRVIRKKRSMPRDKLKPYLFRQVCTRRTAARLLCRLRSLALKSCASGRCCATAVSRVRRERGPRGAGRRACA
jgi:hypothetical protein